MSMTGLYDCHNFKIFVDDIMRDSNFGMGVLHVKVKYWRIFCDVISLLARVFIVSFDRAYKEVSTKKYWKFSVAQFLWYDCTLQKPMFRPCDLDLWPMKVNYFLWIDYQPISVLYKFEIDRTEIRTSAAHSINSNLGVFYCDHDMQDLTKNPRL